MVSHAGTGGTGTTGTGGAIGTDGTGTGGASGAGGTIASSSLCNGTSTAGCHGQPEVCGDGIINQGGIEQCDDGVNSGEYGTCNPDCSLAPRCGDGAVQSDYGEECEPSTPNDPTCTRVCRRPGGCGDGVTTPPEECDDGASFNTGDYGTCAPSCIYAPHCGDGIINGPEEDCDDNMLDGSYGGCTPQCKLAPHCGDGILNGPEECDHGPDNGTDGQCTTSCKIFFFPPP
jgi:hypothetical protein